MKHFLEVLNETIKRDWELNALCNWRGEKFTFKDLAVQIEKFHLIFENAGVKKGQKIALCGTNSARWAISFLSVTTYEAVVVPLLSDFTPESINNLVDHSESVILFTDKDMWPKLDKEKMPKLRAAVCLQDLSLLWGKDEQVKDAFASVDSAFAEKYLKQGTKIVATGRIQTGSYTNKDGNKVYTTDVVVEEQEFAESKGSGGSGGGPTNGQQANAPKPNDDGFMNIPEGIDEELPFN